MGFGGAEGDEECAGVRVTGGSVLARSTVSLTLAFPLNHDASPPTPSPSPFRS